MRPLNPETYLLEAGFDEFEIEVEAGTDLDDRFTAWIVDTGEKIKVNGWLCTMERI